VTQRPPALQTLFLLWIALVASQFVMLIPLFLVPPPAEPSEPMLPMMFGALAMAIGVAALVVPKAVLRKAVLAQRIPLTEVPDPNPNVLPGFNKTIKVAADPEAATRSLLPAYQARTILGCALCEAITLLGFVLKFLGFGWEVAIPFFALGIGFCLLQMPSAARLRAAIEDVIGAPLGS
jgi:hypothetical protein